MTTSAPPVAPSEFDADQACIVKPGDVLPLEQDDGGVSESRLALGRYAARPCRAGGLWSDGRGQPTPALTDKRRTRALLCASWDTASLGRRRSYLAGPRSSG